MGSNERPSPAVQESVRTPNRKKALDKPAKICGRLWRPIEKRCARAPGHLLARLEALGMKPVINSHLDYRRFLNGIGGMYRINWRSKPPAIREIYLRFRELDLSAVDRIMQDQYSSRGAEPRPPSCMLRSLLLMIVMNVVSVTHWFETLHTSQFFAVLSGFQPWDIPGVGTFYDFIDRLWNYATPNFSPHCKPPVRKKVKKPKEKGD